MAKKLNHEKAYRGEKAMSRLSGRLVVICGVGALGSPLADALARMGVDSIRVIDMDRVEEHNVSTQLYGDGDVGATKVAALQNHIFRDTGVEIDTFDKELKEGNAKKALKDAVLVIDAFDNMASRRLLQTICRQNRLPCLHGGMFDNYGEVVWDQYYTVPEDPKGAAVDICDYPLARNLATLVSTVMAEEVVRFLTEVIIRTEGWSITLGDLKIGKYR